LPLCSLTQCFPAKSPSSSCCWHLGAFVAVVAEAAAVMPVEGMPIAIVAAVGATKEEMRDVVVPENVAVREVLAAVVAVAASVARDEAVFVAVVAEVVAVGEVGDVLVTGSSPLRFLGR